MCAMTRVVFSKFLMAGAVSISMSAHAGFQVSGDKLLDSNGNPFIMRGVNHPHAWFTGRTQSALADIASVGANSVRVVLADGQRWSRTSSAEVSAIIAQAKSHNLIVVLEVHDATGWGEQAGAGILSNVTDYWLGIADVLRGQEDYVIINIANEPFGNGVPVSTWVDEHITAIQRLRNAGLTHTLMVDAANWGQDWQQIMLENASTVAAGDSLNNTMFSVHMYEVYQNRNIIENYVATFLAVHGLPLIVGEFGADHYGQQVDVDSILAVSEEYGIGYLGWSWSGNNSEVASLDITLNWNVNNLSPWGERLINGVNGIRETAEMATVFSTEDSSSSSSSSVQSSSSSSSSSSVPGGTQCNWYGTVYPVCATTQNGWGWENNQSCVARTDCAAQPSPYGVIGEEGSSSSSSSFSSSSLSSSSTSSSSSSSSAPAPSGNCVYEITNEWGDGYTATIRITNTGSVAINDWQVSWSYSDGRQVTHAWNATLSGSNPYSASGMEWNSSIPPGQSVEFGFQGTQSQGAATVPSVTGAVCNQ